MKQLVAVSRTFVVFAFTVVTLPSLAAPTDFKELERELQKAQKSFSDTIDLPFDKIVVQRDPDLLRNRYKVALQTLDDAVVLVGEKNLALAKTKLESALFQFRSIGLLMPFVSIGKTDEEMDAAVTKYLKAEDSLAVVLKDLVSPILTSDSLKIFRDDKLVWAWTGKKLNAKDAVDQCEQFISVPETSGWHVPKQTEFAPHFRNIKDPQKNMVFGKEAAEFGPVWAGADAEQPAPSGKQYILDFTKEELGENPVGDLLPVICLGKNEKSG